MMEGKIRVTDTTTYLKKYVLSWFIPLLALLLYFWSNKSVLVHVILLLSLLTGVLFARLRVLEYTKNSIFLDGKKFNFEEVISLKIFEINIYQFLLFKVKKSGKTKRYFVDPGKHGLLAIIFSLLSDKSSLRKLKVFLELMEEKGKTKS